MLNERVRRNINNYVYLPCSSEHIVPRVTKFGEVWFRRKRFRWKKRKKSRGSRYITDNREKKRRKTGKRIRPLLFESNLERLIEEETRLYLPRVYMYIYIELHFWCCTRDVGHSLSSQRKLGFLEFIRIYIAIDVNDRTIGTRGDDDDRGCGTPRRTSLAFLYNRNQLIDPLRMWPIVARKRREIIARARCSHASRRRGQGEKEKRAGTKRRSTLIIKITPPRGSFFLPNDRP